MIIVAHETGVLNQLDLVETRVAMAVNPSASHLLANPLGKIPALVTDDGMSIIDSSLICEFLNARTKSGLLPSEENERWRHRFWQSLADGLTDILLLWRVELLCTNSARVALTDGWSLKANASMNRLEDEALVMRATPFGIGQIAVICALGQLDFRWHDCMWRHKFPTLAALDQSYSNRSSIVATKPVKDTDPNADDITKGRLFFEQRSIPDK